MCPFVFYQIVKNSLGWFFYNKCVFVGSLVGIFTLSSHAHIENFGPICSFQSNSIAWKRCAAARVSFYVGVIAELGAGSFTTVGGSHVELCMIKSRAGCTWLLYVQHLHSGGSASSRHPPTCLSHSWLSDVTRTLVVLSVLTHLCIHVTVCFFRAFVKCTFLSILVSLQTLFFIFFDENLWFACEKTYFPIKQQ